MSSRLETTLSITLVASAVAVAGLFAYRQVLAPQETRTGRSEEKPVFLENWEQFSVRGIRVGPDLAPVQIVEFVDFECPFCRSFYDRVEDLAGRFPGSVSTVYLHYPLTSHRFARAAARAAECGDAQHRFAEMVRDLFAGQDSFGLKPWTAYASAAEVADTADFSRCMASPEEHPRIGSGIALAESIGARGTPTVIVNGWRFFSPPSAAELASVVEKAATGKSPF